MLRNAALQRCRKPLRVVICFEVCSAGIERAVHLQAQRSVEPVVLPQAVEPVVLLPLVEPSCAPTNSRAGCAPAQVEPVELPSSVQTLEKHA
jgi:hypothetical protein